MRSKTRDLLRMQSWLLAETVAIAAVTGICTSQMPPGSITAGVVTSIVTFLGGSGFVWLFTHMALRSLKDDASNTQVKNE